MRHDVIEFEVYSGQLHHRGLLGPIECDLLMHKLRREMDTFKVRGRGLRGMHGHRFRVALPIDAPVAVAFNPLKPPSMNARHRVIEVRFTAEHPPIRQGFKAMDMLRQNLWANHSICIDWDRLARNAFAGVDFNDVIKRNNVHDEAQIELRPKPVAKSKFMGWAHADQFCERWSGAASSCSARATTRASMRSRTATASSRSAGPLTAGTTTSSGPLSVATAAPPRRASTRCTTWAASSTSL
jgi:hypothetical protein